MKGRNSYLMLIFVQCLKGFGHQNILICFQLKFIIINLNHHYVEEKVFQWYFIRRERRNIVKKIIQVQYAEMKDVHILYTGLFSPVFLALLHLQTVLPCLEFALIQLCIKRDSLRNLKSPSLKFAYWQQGQKGQK